MPKYTELDLITGAKSDHNIDETRDFKGCGGEKSIFVKGQKAFGVYHQPQNAMPVERCKELAVLTHPSIVKPEGLLFKGTKRVGETMMAVQDPWVLCSLFTMTFRKQHQIDENALARIVKQMNEIVSHAHQHAIYVVDNNENNWLLSPDFRRVFAIDTGNWQTKSFPATVIMLNIRDPFNQPGAKADWYAQAILLANLYIGKHPFEAAHPKYDHLPKASVENGINRRPRMEAMMRDKVAFFDPGCTLNRACYPLDSIPAALKRWMQSTLMGTTRTAPPDDFEVVATSQKIMALAVSKSFKIEKLFTTVGDIFRVVTCSTVLDRAILAESKWYYGKQAYDFPDTIPNRHLVHIAFQRDGQPVMAWINSEGKLKLHSTTAHGAMIEFNAEHLITVDGRLIVINGSRATEVSFNAASSGLNVSMTVVGQVVDIPQATHAYPGCLIQNVLGSWRVLTFPREGRCVSTRLIDVEGGQVVDAKYEFGVFMVLGVRKGVYSRYLYFEDDANTLHLVHTEPNVSHDAMNWTVNARRTMTIIENDGVLLALRTNTMTPTVTPLRDAAISTDMTLTAERGSTHFFRGNELYSLSVK